MRMSRTVLRGALGETPEVYSLHDTSPHHRFSLSLFRAWAPVNGHKGVNSWVAIRLAPTLTINGIVLRIVRCVAAALQVLS
jgi:hypothetical protein